MSTPTADTGRAEEQLAERLWRAGLQPETAGRAAAALLDATRRPNPSRWVQVYLGSEDVILHVRVHDDVPLEAGRPASSPETVSTGRMVAVGGDGAKLQCPKCGSTSHAGGCQTAVGGERR